MAPRNADRYVVAIAWATALGACLFSGCSYDWHKFAPDTNPGIDGGPPLMPNLYVDIDSLGGPCDDERTRGDVTAETPWCNLGAAAEAVQPGDQVLVRAGEYSAVMECATCSGDSVMEISVGGTSENWIQFAAADTETVRITGTGEAVKGVRLSNSARYIELRGFVLDGLTSTGVDVRGQDVVVKDLEITNTGVPVKGVDGLSRFRLEGSLIHDNAVLGFHGAVSLTACGEGNVVRGNRIWNNRAADLENGWNGAIELDGCTGTPGSPSVIIENNVVWNNTGTCINPWRSADVIIRNNTCWMNASVNQRTEITLLTSRVQVFNNIFVAGPDNDALVIRASDGEFTSDLSTVGLEHNLIWAPTHEGLVTTADQTGITLSAFQALGLHNWGANSIGADPMLTNPSAGDMTPRADSPVIDAGSDDDAPSDDALGTRRPQDGDSDGSAVSDIGAIEVNP